MTFIRIFRDLPKRVRVFVAPPYRPEKHYMRGDGPACAARQAARH
jgi:hypothetical protein